MLLVDESLFLLFILAEMCIKMRYFSYFIEKLQKPPNAVGRTLGACPQTPANIPPPPWEFLTTPLVL